MIQYKFDRQYFSTMDDILMYMMENRLRSGTVMLVLNGAMLGVASVTIPRKGRVYE